MATEGPHSQDIEPVGAEECLKPGQLVGSYCVLHPIGQGGMGTVYLAEHRQIGYRAAIKVLHPEYSRHPEVVRRFLNEARAVNIVQHPGIVKIFEFGDLPDRTAYIIMEYLDGEVLTRRLERAGGRLLPADALRIGRQVASTLAAAHRRNVIHRDLKPGNIMLVPDPAVEGKERVKLLDFGLAKVAESYRHSSPRPQTRTGVVLGTAMYMAPEQCRGARDVDGRADVYALGVVLYEMLCGRPPFVADSEGELVTMQLRDEPPQLRDLEPSVPEELAAVVHRMLIKDPQQRPTMAQAAEQLDRLATLWEPAARAPLLADAPSSVTELVPRPPRPRPQPWRWVGLGAAAALVLAALAWAWVERGRPGVLTGGGTWTTVPGGTEYHLRAVWRTGGDTLWAVGDRGTILHGRGVRWTSVPSGTTQSLRGVWGAGPKDVWAVGGQGTILHWNGLAWAPSDSGTTIGLRGVWGAGPKDVWAVGEQGMILHFDGQRWSRVPSGATDDFRAVWGFPPARAGAAASDVWAVGEYGLVVHWEGTGWGRVRSGTTSRLAKVWGLSPRDLWVVGNEGTILRWDGKGWRPQPSGTGEELSAVWGHGPDDLWVAGNEGTLLHWDGRGWRRPERRPTQRWIYGLCDGPQPGELWAVGTYGTILRHRP